MEILVIGEQKNFNECLERFGKDHQYTWLGEHRDFEGFLDQKDLVFDFTIDQDPYSIESYAKNPVKVFFNTCMISLAELTNLTSPPFKCTLFGFNGMPTFLSHSLMEVCLWRTEDQPELEKVCKALNTKFSIVDDRVGLV